MTLQHVDILFQLIVFLFAISIHESAHAWMANRCGDPTASMLGRITLNPIKHIDPFGTVILPLIALISHFPVLGWAKPTPVNPKNFKNPMRDDILTSVVGPISNFVVVIGALTVLVVIASTSQLGGEIVRVIPRAYPEGLNDLGSQTNSFLLPLSLLFYDLMTINIVLAIFNLIPLPPLDGSHVLRHFLSGPVLQAYDRIGWIGLMLLVYLGGGFLWKLIHPVMGFFDSILMKV
jgi:Zn-dependent protease